MGAVPRMKIVANDHSPDREFAMYSNFEPDGCVYTEMRGAYGVSHKYYHHYFAMYRNYWFRQYDGDEE